MTLALSAALAVVLGLAGAWELLGAREARSRPRAWPVLPPSIARVLRIDAALVAAGLEHRIAPVAMALLQLPCALIGALAGELAAPAAPGHLAPLVPLGAAGAGLLAPRAYLAMVARRRLDMAVSELPDILDAASAQVAAGRAPDRALAAFGEGTGALRRELARLGADLEAGFGSSHALADLRRRLPATPIGIASATVERARELGTPVADQLADQASSVRRSLARETAERAAKAAPKIQLTVAMVLVPSALLVIAAALAAHSGTLLAGF